MIGDAQSNERVLQAARPSAGERETLPPPSAAERSFWRRAVADERARCSRRRPAPFPFQQP